MKPDTSDTYTGTSNLSDVTRGAGGRTGSYSNPNSGGEDVGPSHSNISDRPGMRGSAGSELAPDFPGSVAETEGGLPTRIMESGVDYDWPGSAQGNLEPRTDGRVKGA